MAKTKNTFIKSRMNKDLDERIVPNGEYRDGFNIAVSQSEDADVGTVSTALGNSKLTDFGLTADCDARIIGYFTDEKDKDIYIFITNFVDTSNDKLSSFPNQEAICQIWKRNIETNLNTKLVEGNFLNFSLTHEVLSINLLEDLLFWTDNRNQPRKINVTKANPGNVANPTYYTNEDQISVAKYYPFAPIELLENYVVNYNVVSAGGGTAVAPADYWNNLNQIVQTTVQTPNGTGVGIGLTVQITSAGTSTLSEGNGNLVGLKIINPGQGYQSGDVINIAPKIGSAQITIVIDTQSTMKDKCTEFLPETFIPSPAPSSITSNTVFQIAGGSNTPGQKFAGAIVKIEDAAGQIAGTEGAIVNEASFGVGGLQLKITWKNNPQTVSSVTKITLGVNPDYDANFPGDCDFLKDKFVRFAYRFKFDDNEYSLISPFTQACFTPKQNGYFLSESRNLPGNTPSTETVTDAELAYKSTDLEFFENSVNSIDLKIPSPQYLGSIDNFFSNALEKMHIEEIDIIYKDDEENALKVVDTLTKESFENLKNSYIVYNYQSRKPYKTLPSNEIIRVSDIVPLKSLTQEVAGNRVIYGNYTDGHTSNESLNYQIAAAAKSVLPEVIDAGIIDQQIKKEYQNHTLKQNRTYQVGIVLSDRYGRQSDVILSSLDTSTTITSGDSYRGSTIFRPFYSAGPGLLVNPGSPTVPTTWPGDSLKVQFNSRIPENTGQFGYPGLFLNYDPSQVTNLNGGSGYTSDGSGVLVTGGSGNGMTVNYVITPNEGVIISVTIVNPGSGYLNNDIISIPVAAPNPFASFIFKPIIFPNLTGWHSYKIVVKQQEQDYYNVYLPGIVNGAINEDGIISSTRATLSLYGDNINKVPKDLIDVGPSQTNYRSDIKLSLRVENTSTDSRRFYPGSDIESVVSLSELTDLGINLTRISEATTQVGTPPNFILLGNFNENIQSGMSVSVVNPTGSTIINLSEGAYVKTYIANANGTSSSVRISGTTTAIPALSMITFGPPGIIFNSGNNPIIGILSTSKSIGVAEENNFAALLAVAETQPIKSLLDIFYETTSAGLIDSLNKAVIAGTSDTNIPIAIQNVSFTLSESQVGPVTCTNVFKTTNVVNAPITNANAIGSLVKVVDGTNAPRNSDFEIVNASGTFTIRTKRPAGFGFYISDDARKSQFNFTVKITTNGIDVFTSFSGIIENITPSYVLPQPTIAQFYSKNSRSVIPGWKALNGSGDSSLNQNNLTWELTSVKATSNSENAPFQPNLTVQGPDGNYYPIGSADANNWPVVIRPGNSNGVVTDNLGAVQAWQIVIGRQYLGTFKNPVVLEAPGGQVGVDVNSDEVAFIVNPLNTNTVSIGDIDPDGNPNLWQQYLGLFNPSKNIDPFDVSINTSQAIIRVEWEVKYKVKDGGNLSALEKTILIRQD